MLTNPHERRDRIAADLYEAQAAMLLRACQEPVDPKGAGEHATARALAVKGCLVRHVKRWGPTPLGREVASVLGLRPRRLQRGGGLACLQDRHVNAGGVHPQDLVARHHDIGRAE